MIKNVSRAAIVIVGLVVLILPLSASPLSPDGTPVGCSPHSVHFGQNLVLVYSRGELYRATDDGWVMLSTPSGWTEVTATPDGTIYLYGDDTRRVHRSADGGETWVLMGETPFIDAHGEHLFSSPDSDVIFMGISTFTSAITGIHRSVDGGATWEWVFDEGYGSWIDFSPDFAQDGIAFAAIGGYHTSLGVWKTENWGETWFPVNTGLQVGGFYSAYQWVAVSPQFPEDQTAFMSNGTGLYKTTNGGESWFRVSEWAPYRVALSPNYIRDQTLLMGHPSTGLYLSQDGGQSRRMLREGGVNVVGVRHQGSLGPVPPSPPPPGPYRVYLPLVGRYSKELDFWMVSSGCYLYRSGDDGATWDQLAVFEVSDRLYLPFVNRGQ